MPSPGATALKASMGDVQIPLAGFSNTKIDNNSDFINRLTLGMAAGWIPLYPTTVSNCEVEIENAFNGLVAAGWNSRCWLKSLGKGIDLEMAAWVASWNTATSMHDYAPSVDSIYNSIIAEIEICVFSNSHAYPLPYAVAAAWMAHFVQEAG